MKEKQLNLNDIYEEGQEEALELAIQSGGNDETLDAISEAAMRDFD